MRQSWMMLVLGVALAVVSAKASAQTLPVDDAMIEMWQEGMEENSQAYRLAQALMDSVGPRLTGSPGHLAANEWLVSMFQRWGIEARNEQYGTWMGWDRGITHIDLVEPRVRSLEGMMLAWSPGTQGTARAAVVALPELADSAEFVAWLPQAAGKFVLVSYPQPTCRTDANWEEYATEESFERMQAEREAASDAWDERIESFGYTSRTLPPVLENAGAMGVVSSSWPGGWGVHRIFQARTERVPSVSLSCEDYGLLYRLATNGQAPVLEVEAQATFQGDVPVFNTVAEIRGSEKPDEFVVLSAHLDSWDGASGATDNGTGTVTILEAMRILKAAYPNPKRTIVAGFWGGEEQGLIGSRAFAADHPEVVQGLQSLFNQDNGTGRITRISTQGLTRAGEYFARWMAQLPTEIAQHIELQVPGRPGGGGSDYASFLCHGAPAFFLFAHSWSYWPYTWHTNRDSFDKVVMDDLRNNATLFAMLTYLAAEEPEQMPRDQRVLPISERTGEQMTWPQCREPRRSWGTRR